MPHDRISPIAANAAGSSGTFRIPPERIWSVATSLAGGCSASRVTLRVCRLRGMVRADGIEPTRPLWKSGVLPLNYARMAQCGELRARPASVKPAHRIGCRAVLAEAAGQFHRFVTRLEVNVGCRAR